MFTMLSAMDGLRQQYWKISLALARFRSSSSGQSFHLDASNPGRTSPPPISKSRSDEDSPSSSEGYLSRSSSAESPSSSNPSVCLDPLVPPPYGMDEAHISCLEGTRTVLLDEIKAWMIDASAPRLYILRGMLGQGKSTIAHTISADADALGCLGAKVFLKRHGATPTNIYRSIATQLAHHTDLLKQSSEWLSAINWDDPAFSMDGPGHPFLSLNTILIQAAVKFLKDSRHPVVIIIDGLDECNFDEEHGLSFLRAFNRLVELVPFLKVFITIRSRFYLDRFILSAPRHMVSVSELNDSDSREDIEVYLRWHLISHTGLDWRATEADVCALTDMAGGVFFVAASAVRFILNKTGLSKFDPSTRMKMVLHPSILNPSVPSSRSSFRDDLDSVYMSVMEKAAPSESAEDLENFLLTLGIFLTFDYQSSYTLPLFVPDTISADFVQFTLDRLRDVIVLDVRARLKPYHPSFISFILCPERAGKMAIDFNRCLAVRQARFRQLMSHRDGVSDLLDAMCILIDD